MLELSNFASIGKAVLYRAIGLQKNYKEVITQEHDILDEAETGCYSCQNFITKNFTKYCPETVEYKTCLQICENCPKKVFYKSYNITTIYRNEFNKFGYAPRLKRFPILLFLVYHFLGVDKNGIIKNVNINDLAEFFNCEKRTIQAANKKLSEYGYIITGNGIDPNNYINIMLPEYTKYFSTAIEGGRGYYICSKELFTKLAAIDNITALRIQLRKLLEHDDQSISGNYKGELTHTYKEIRRALPDYCKPNVIKKSLENNMEIFNICADNDTITFKLNPAYQAKLIKNELFEHNKGKISNLINKFNDIVNNLEFNQDKLAIDFSEFIISKSDVNYSPIVVNDKDLDDLSSMSVQYTYEIVVNALSEVYKIFIIPGAKIKNFGGLIRTTIKKNLNLIETTSKVIAA